MASLKYSANSDLQTVTLGSGYTAGSGSLVLTSGHGAKLPATGDFWLRSESPYVCFKVTSRSTDTLTVTAGADGTSDTNLSAGATLHWVLGVAALDQLRSDIIGTGTYASASSEKAGKLYLPSDGLHLVRDTGAALALWGPIYPCEMPDFSSFTQVNAGSATFAAYGSAYSIYCPALGSVSLKMLERTAPATPYTLTCGFFHKVWVNYNSCGIGFRENSSGKVETLSVVYDSGLKIIRTQYNNSTNWNANATVRSVPQWAQPMWLRIKDDGTNRYYYYSNDGLIWYEHSNVGRTNHLTADRLVLVCDSNSTEPTSIVVFHWVVT